MWGVLTALIPSLVGVLQEKVIKDKVPQIVKDVIGSEDINKADPDQLDKIKFEVEKIVQQVELMKTVNNTMVEESKSDNWLTRSWRPLTILGTGFLLFIMVASAVGLGVYFMQQPEPAFKNFLELYSTVIAPMFLESVNVFGMLVGGLAILRTTEKAGLLEKLFKK